MQQFTVPQFIDVEDKVIGFITVRQFIILLAAALLVAICYKTLDFTAFLAVGIFIVFVAIVIAFAKINGVHFHVFFVNFLITLFKPNVRVWNNAFGKEYVRIESERVSPKEKIDPSAEKNFSSSRLTELSMIVDTQGVFKGASEDEDDGLSYTKEVHSRD